MCSYCNRAYTKGQVSVSGHGGTGKSSYGPLFQVAVHWVLDIAFCQDDSRIRKGNGAENFAVLRHIALNLLRREKITKRNLKGKRMIAAWDKGYLLKALTG